MFIEDEGYNGDVESSWDGSVFSETESSKPDTGVNGHPAELDVEVSPLSGSSSTPRDEVSGEQVLEDALLAGVDLFFGDLDWDLPDDPELMAMLTRV